MNLDPYSSAIYHNTFFFNILHALILFVASMGFWRTWDRSRDQFSYATVIACLCQYLVLPIFSFLFAYLFALRAELCIVIYLLASFPNNRFSLLITWVAQGSAVFAALLSIISVLVNLTLTPYIFFTLMYYTPVTHSMMAPFSYWDFIYLLFSTRMHYLFIIITAVLLGLYVGKKLPLFYEIIRSKVLWIVACFMASFAIITYTQSEELFSNYWHFFSWEVLLYNLGVLAVCYGVVRAAKLFPILGKTIVLSSAENFIPLCFLILFAWYPDLHQGRWLLTVQVPIFHWMLLFLALFLRNRNAGS